MKKGDSGKLQMLISQLEMSLETVEKQGMNKWIKNISEFINVIQTVPKLHLLSKNQLEQIVHKN